MAFSDAAADRDQLGFEPYAQAWAEMIVKPETIPPVVIGVYGPWGSGKSTLRALVKNHLERWGKANTPLGLAQRIWQFPNGKTRDQTISKISCVEYNAWAYTDAIKLWAGLVEQVSRRLGHEIT